MTRQASTDDTDAKTVLVVLGGIVGAIVFCCIIVAAAFTVRQKRKRKRRKSSCRARVRFSLLRRNEAAGNDQTIGAPIIEIRIDKKPQAAAAPLSMVRGFTPADDDTNDIYSSVSGPGDTSAPKKPADLAVTTERPTVAACANDVYSVIDNAAKKKKFVAGARQSQAEIFDADTTSTCGYHPPPVLRPRDLSLPIHDLFEVITYSPAMAKASSACSSRRGLRDELAPQEKSTVV